MKEDLATRKEARPWLPIIIFLFLLLVTVAKIAETQESMERNMPYKVEPTTTITAR